MKIGRYHIQRQIAEGGQGRVLLGYDPRLKRRVAVKLYRLPDQRQSRRQVLREARRSALLESPRITRIYDVLVAGNDLAIIMQYVPGCDLREVLRGTRLSLPAALSIASDIAAALSVAKRFETVHGDIKPANILIDDNGRALLTDFGVAQVGDDSTARGFSNSALTPEHVRGVALSPASDMFGFGALLYYLIAGERPFVDAEPGRQALCEGRFSPLAGWVDDRDIPPELDVLVTRMLAPDPRHRPDSLHAVRQALRAASLSLPLGESAPVRAETRSYYRSESTADVPRELVSDFGGDSRGRRLNRRVRFVAARYPVILGVSVCAVLSLGVVLWVLRPGPCVALQPPDVRADAVTTISADISRDWLQSALRRGIEQALQRVQLQGLAGNAGPRSVGRAARGTPCAADYRLQLRLRCRSSLCLVSLVRNGLPLAATAPLFADATLHEWSGAIDRLSAMAVQ